MTDLTAQRRFFAEEIQVVSNLQSAALVDALAAVPSRVNGRRREAFRPAVPKPERLA